MSKYYDAHKAKETFCRLYSWGPPTKTAGPGLLITH